MKTTSQAHEMVLKNNFPFRVGCTSYVIPEDILPNVEFMADKVDDIELVLFESNEWSNIPDTITVSSLQAIALEENLTYSIHLPIDRKAGSPDTVERGFFIDRIADIIASTAILPVSGYLLHFEGSTSMEQNTEIAVWQRSINDFCTKLTHRLTIDPQMICIENLSYQPELHAEIVRTFGFSNCIDIGHLWLQKNNRWEEYVRTMLSSTKILHLHGVTTEGNDHRSLADHDDRNQLNCLISLVNEYAGVVTFEVFSEQDTFESFQLFEGLWQTSRL